jgi:Na+/H+ antiporter NhaA
MFGRASASTAQESFQTRTQRSFQTRWDRARSAPLRSFLQTESASAGILVAAVAAALIWVNVSASSYNSVWRESLSIRLGDVGFTYDLQTWVNSGLMTFFFLVVGLEARREFDLGDLRERRRFILPFVAGLAGMAVPVAIYLLINHGQSSAHGWGTAMSTDTALALGLLALLGRDVPDRVRVFLLTVFVVDDLAALVVIAIVYSNHVSFMALAVAVAAFALFLVVTKVRTMKGPVPILLGVATWAALMKSGVDPVVAGLLIGLSQSAYTPARDQLEQATVLIRLFREQPTAELARSARAGLTSTISPNARLQAMLHSWTSYVIVPLFALANAGIVLNAHFLAHAYTAPITLGVLIGYTVGKPIAVIGTSYVVCWLSRGRIRPPVGWAAVIGSGTIAGIGFTVALLIASRAFHGAQLDEAKLGALSAGFVASALTWAVYRLTGLLSPEARDRALLGNRKLIQDLIPEVDPAADHMRGPEHSLITLIEFGDFECPYCGEAEAAVRELLTDSELRYIWRHLPLTDVHPNAQLAAEATEAAGKQGAFWAMHDLLLSRQDRLGLEDLIEYAGELGLDVEQFRADLAEHAYAARVAQDVESADLSGASGTPTFFINGQRHYGSFDLSTLSAAITTARAEAAIDSAPGRAHGLSAS